MRWGQGGMLGPRSSALWLQRAQRDEGQKRDTDREKDGGVGGWEDLRLSTSQVPT